MHLIELLKSRLALAGSVVVWKNSLRKHLDGKLAGTVTPAGYVVINISCDGHMQHIYIYAHRAVWMMHNNILLKSQDYIDHIDGDRPNNNPINLRIVTSSQNARNQRIASSRSKSKILGVVWNKPNRKWKACTWLNGKIQNLGYFEDVVDAVTAYWMFRKKAEPDMWPTWKYYYTREKLKARKQFSINCGPDGQATNVSLKPIVSSRFLHKLKSENSKLLKKASKAIRLIDVVMSRFALYHGFLIWRSFSVTYPYLGCIAGSSRSDGRAAVSFYFSEKCIELNISTVAWMLHNGMDMPAKTRVVCIDGDKSNISLKNLELRTYGKKTKRKLIVVKKTK